jgi:hypothetical protein
MFRMHQPRNLLEFSSQTEVRFLLLVKDTGYTVASRVVLHRGSGAVLLPRDQAAMLNMLQLTRAANHGRSFYNSSRPQRPGCNAGHAAANQGKVTTISCC